MAIAIIGKALDAIKSISELTSKVIDAGDSEKFAKSVDELCKGVDDTYEAMRKIILESNKFSEEEKLEKLEALAKQETKTKETCGEAINGNRENVANITVEIFKGFLTCGLYFVPAMIKDLKSENCKEKDISEMESLTASNDILE